MRLYLDNCSFNRPFDDQSKLKIRMETEAKLHIQQGIIDGRYELVWSYILEFENNQNKFDDKRNAIYGWKQIAKVYCLENKDIVEYAEKLTLRNIRPKDALHISCAIFSQSGYLITVDRHLYKLQLQDIKIVNPITFIDEMEG